MMNNNGIYQSYEYFAWVFPVGFCTRYCVYVGLSLVSLATVVRDTDICVEYVCIYRGIVSHPDTSDYSEASGCSTIVPLNYLKLWVRFQKNEHNR